MQLQYRNPAQLGLTQAAPYIPIVSVELQDTLQILDGLMELLLRS